jgi:hypothetical protein
MEFSINNLNIILQKLKELNYKEYLIENKINELPYIGVDYDDRLWNKINKKWESIDPNNSTEFPPDFFDLVRLHYLLRLRKVRIVLEFGVGKSSSVFVDAIRKNKTEYEEYVNKNLRVTNPFKVYSIDNNKYWMEKVTKAIDKKEFLEIIFSDCHMSEYNGKICTFYDCLPNIRPDFIYLDGPAQFGVKEHIRGISTDFPDRMPMAADILAIEYFLEPGTMIVVDGRTANARFLKNNLQQNWQYMYDEEFDQSFFLLDEPPLGKWNKRALEFTDKPNITV